MAGNISSPEASHSQQFDSDGEGTIQDMPLRKNLQRTRGWHVAGLAAILAPVPAQRNHFQSPRPSGMNFPMRRTLGLLAVFFSLALAAFPAAAAATKVDLILSASAARPGDTVLAGIHLTMPPGWHTYWRYPGDAGIATSVKWTLPPGITAGPIQWPVPDKLLTPPLTSYLYSNEVTLLVPLIISTDAPPGSVELKGVVKWQECSELCVLGQQDVAAPLTIGSESTPSPDEPLIQIAATKLPATDSKLVADAHWEKDGESRPLLIEWQSASAPAQADFFPFENDNYDVKGDTERLPDVEGDVRLRKLVEKSGDTWPTKIDGLLVSRADSAAPWQGHEVSLNLSALAAAPAPATASTPTPPANQSFILMLGLAFVGGLILNIMPCVLPVIALKVLGFVNQARETPARVRTLGLIYGAGVLASFLVLAAVNLAIQRAGGLASWSSAFQNPQFRVIITTLITLVALNLFGVFEITLPGSAMNAAGNLSAKTGAAGAFFNGILATAFALPCTASVLGSAVTFALTQPPAVLVLIFLSVGAGLAAPFVLLCWNPALLKFLPKPGAWMLRFKVAMGFPMLATAVWLFWVTATRLGKSGVLWFGLFLVVISFATWIWGEFAQRNTKRIGLAMVISLLLAASGYGFILEHQLHWRSPFTEPHDSLNWQPWSDAAVAKARNQGRPVLVDFTADTCINCQVNKIISIDIQQTRDKLKAINAVTLVADFTDADPAIAAELRKFDRPGVPLVLVYPADKSRPPIVLPPLLTPGIVMDALNQAAPQP
jgi:thiol:disulfide interchange protein